MANTVVVPDTLRSVYAGDGENSQAKTSNKITSPSAASAYLRVSSTGLGQNWALPRERVPGLKLKSSGKVAAHDEGGSTRIASSGTLLLRPAGFTRQAQVRNRQLNSQLIQSLFEH